MRSWGERSLVWMTCGIALLGILAGSAVLAVGDWFSAARADTRGSDMVAEPVPQATVAGGGCNLNSRGGRAEADRLAIAPSARLPRRAPGTPSSGTVLTLPRSLAGPVIPPAFLGLSFEYRAIEAYAGFDSKAIDPVLERLISNLSPGQRPWIRIGGDSTDWTWWPVPRMRRPPGVSYDITTRWIAVTRALATALRARLILGVNLEADSGALAVAEARALRNGIGASSIAALEPGNEPELYPVFGWYCSSTGREVPGRPRSYNFPAFVRDFSTITRRLPSNVPLAGPTVGDDSWFPGLARFLKREPHVGLVTLHRYPLLMWVPPTSPRYGTVGNLLSDASSRGLADSIAPYVRIAHASGLPIRIDEMNSVAAGAAPGVANSFASALWIVDALFEMARVGVDGVNIHTFPGATYELFHFRQVGGRWEAVVSPEYYGLLMFAQAAPAGSRLVTIADQPADPVKAWATYSPNRTTRVVLINNHPTQQTVTLKANRRAGLATLAQLRAPDIQSIRGVTLGGQSFDPQTDTGVLAGPPSITTVKPSKQSYVISLPPSSAAMLTIGRPCVKVPACVS